MKRISLAVADFALPSPRTGSIDAHSGLGRSAQLGQELHQKVQAQRLAKVPGYRAEVAIAGEFSAGEFVFEVRGRMDGFFAGPHPKIEEIKSSFNIEQLARAIKAAPDEHPYALQLKTYGHLHALREGVVPALSLHLISSRNGDSLDLELDFDRQAYEGWLERRLAELVEEVEGEGRRHRRRKKAAAALTFPFERPRAGQVELIQTVEQGMREGVPLLLQAPTGLGKTMGVLYPALREALARGQRVIYVTPKNSQHAVAEEAVERLQEAGAPLKALTITAKSKMCFKNEPLCNPEYCEFAREHYTKVAAVGLPAKLAKKKNLTARVFRKVAREHEVCPFELQLDTAAEADAVICDYNYVFAPRSAFGRLTHNGLLGEGKPNLVIDEAHNLPGRALDYASPSLSSVSLLRLREDATRLPARFRRQTQEQIDDCLAVIRALGAPGRDEPHEIDPPHGIFLDRDEELRGFLSGYLASDTEIQAQDPVLRLCFYWSEFTNALELVRADRERGGGRFVTTFSPGPPTVRITCCDASDLLRPSYGEYANVVAFSATLKPFEFYSRLAGLESAGARTAEFPSPFSRERRKIVVIPQISTKFSERERSFPRVAEAIERITSLKRGNYIAFFPSFEFMEKVLARMRPRDDRLLLRQERHMRREEIEAVLERLREPGGAHLLFAVQGGVFSEGVDYPGRMVIGAFIVGPPLPTFSLEREKMRQYFEKNTGAGFDYAYTFPAMAKAVQAAGRVIRSENDEGLIVLMDDRFLRASYANSMPADWFERDPRELVSSSILAEIAAFWEEREKKAAPTDGREGIESGTPPENCQ